MLVKCRKSYEDVKEGDTGRVLKLDNDGLNDLNVHAAWANKGGMYWVIARTCAISCFISFISSFISWFFWNSQVRYVHIQLLRDESAPLSNDQLHLMLTPIDVGDKVCSKLRLFVRVFLTFL